MQITRSVGQRFCAMTFGSTKLGWNFVNRKNSATGTYKFTRIKIKLKREEKVRYRGKERDGDKETP